MKTLALVSAFSALVLLGTQATGTEDSAKSKGATPAREACQADVQKLCSGINPGEGRILRCLKKHQDSVSDKCKEALKGASRAHKKL